MSDSETEDEILDRIEAALRKIAGATQALRPAPASDDGVDRAAMAATLDQLISQLREALEPPVPPAE